MQIEYGFATFDVTIRSAHYNEPVDPRRADCDEKPGWEIDFTAICLLDDEKVTDQRLLAELHNEIARKFNDQILDNFEHKR